MRPVFVDCDTGIDDALALWYLASRPDLEIVGVGTVHGNIDPVRAARNSLVVLEAAGRSDTPVACGAHRPLAQDVHLATFVHGEDGLGNTHLDPPAGRPVRTSAAELLVETARRYAGRLEMLAIGPLTNLALAVLLEPELPRLLRRVVVMGGALRHPGNVSPLAEANIWHDPEAAALVLSAGLPATLVTLDVTTQVLLEGERLARLEAASGPLARLASSVLSFYLDFYARDLGRRACVLHDPLAAVLLAEPALAEVEAAVVAVELARGLARGATIVDRRAHPDGTISAPPIDVVTRVEPDVIADAVLGALLGADR
jgi:purine nucleosidase